ncbi:hypothetical protein [Microbacterium sp. P01]|uniref:hypothetical protein n=1 Tax=unclassified Microbacterium TaxID=2609290 RepID=UPI0036725E5F
MSIVVDPAGASLDATVLAVPGVTGLFPAHGTLPQIPARVAAVVTSAEAPSDVSLVTRGDSTLITARISASMDTPVRETAYLVGERLAEMFPDPSVKIEIRVARIQ